MPLINPVVLVLHKPELFVTQNWESLIQGTDAFIPLSSESGREEKKAFAKIAENATLMLSDYSDGTLKSVIAETFIRWRGQNVTCFVSFMKVNKKRTISTVCIKYPLGCKTPEELLKKEQDYLNSRN